jgi:hypothetical protein
MPCQLHTGLPKAHFGTRVQGLNAALDVRARRSQQKVSEIAARLRTIETENTVNGAGNVSVVHLEVTELPSKLQGVPSVNLGKILGSVPGVVGLRPNRVISNREVVEDDFESLACFP